MSTVPAVEIDGNDVTDEIQDKSLSIKLNSVDVTLIDPAVMPAISDVLTVDTPAWTGTVNQVETVGYEGDKPFVKVRATNVVPLPDNGAGAFNLSDAGTGQSSPAGYRDLSVNSQLQGSTTEVRAKVTVFKQGLEAGDEIALTSVVHGYTAETFTIMDLTTDYPVETGARYTLDLGLGDYATATTGANGGGPLSPIRFGTTTGVYGPTSGGLGGGAGSPSATGTAVLVNMLTGFSTSIGTHDVTWSEILGTEGSTDYSMVFPARMGLLMQASDTEIACTAAGIYTIQFVVSGTAATTGSFSFGFDNLSYPNWTHTVANDEHYHSMTTPMGVGEILSGTYVNVGAFASLDAIYLLITRHSSWDAVA